VIIGSLIVVVIGGLGISGGAGRCLVIGEVTAFGILFLPSGDPVQLRRHGLVLVFRPRTADEEGERA